MKRILSAALALTAIVSAKAQTYEDAVRINTNDVEGTARSQAMGGAFGALGSDLTSMTINPAGIAGYRATEVGLTLGFSHVNSESNYYGNNEENDKINMPLYQLGAAFNFNMQNEATEGIIGSTLGISYTQLGNYSASPIFKDYYGLNSYLDYFCLDGVYDNDYSGTLAYKGFMTRDTTFSDGTSQTYNIWEKYIKDDPNHNLDSDYRVNEDGDGLIDHAQFVKQRGYKGETTIAYAVNVSNKWYFGASMGVQTYSFSHKMLHNEINYGDIDANTFDYATELKQNGTGVNFKIGAIAKPANFLRLGVSFNSPTFFSINERWLSYLVTPKYATQRSPRGEYDYLYRVPGSVVLSAAGIIGKSAILSLDYETSNWSNGRFKEKSDDVWGVDDFSGSNDGVKNALKRVNTLRLGAEYRVITPLYLRVGYKTSSSPYKKDVQYNTYKNEAYSGGLGFRHNNFFLDLAYVHKVQTRDYWVLPDVDLPYEANLPAELNTVSNNIVLTAGLRF